MKAKLIKIFSSFKLYFFFLICAFFVFIIPYILGVFFFPDKIYIVAGEEQSFEFNVPAVASIRGGEEYEVDVNNERLNERFDFSLNKPFSICSQKECTLDMEISVLGIPVKNVKMKVLPEMYVVPCGMTVGVRIDTDGIMVLGIGSVETEEGERLEPCKDKIHAGDIIKKVNGKAIFEKEELIYEVENCIGSLNIEAERDGKILNTAITPVKGKEDGKNKMGIWVRDSTQGIGTITYYDENTLKFGGLGHGITDVDTKKIMKVKTGNIMRSEIVSVKKGKNGSPGELVGNIEKNDIIGTVKENNDFGIYGSFYEITEDMPYEKMQIGLRNEVQEGKASILCNIDGTDVKEYEVQIEKVDKYGGDNSKSMIINITDKELLDKTNGIVQGMSGSPIIQNGKLIGAVTHVFVQEPHKGYGIFIENMLQN